MYKVIFFLIFNLYFTCSLAQAGIWKLKISVEPVDLNDKKFNIKKTNINFYKTNGEKITYSPQKIPWGSYKQKEVVIQGQTYFITYWSTGFQNIHFKIFNPNIGTSPLCEFMSDLEETQLKYKNNKLEYQVGERDSKKNQINKSWKTCK